MTQTGKAFAAERLKENPCVAASARIERSILGKYTEIYPHARIFDSEVGDYSYLCEYTDVIYSVIGAFCSIAAFVRINPGNHPMERASQHHFTYRRRLFGFGELDDADFFEWRKSKPCTIGNDVWIGHGAIVTAGVSVGDGAVVGAGAVVTKDVEPYTVAAGVPARFIKRRFDCETAAKLIDTQWWAWPHDKLAACVDDFKDVRSFVEKYSK